MSRSRRPHGRPLDPTPRGLLLACFVLALASLPETSAGARELAAGPALAVGSAPGGLPGALTHTASLHISRPAAGRRLALNERAPNPAPGPPFQAQRAVLPPHGGAPRSPGTQMATSEGRKNPALAGLLSAIVPGAGQAYLGSNSAYAFLGVEVAAWTAHFSTKATGDAKEKEYKRYADGHWSFDRYRDQNSGDCTVDGHSDGGVQDSTLVMLYNTRRNDWYEDIGKLSIYSCGWDSATNRLKYRDMRHDSNTFLSHARTATSVILLNHLVSALLAARGAAKHNLRLTGGLELDWKVTPSLAQTSGTIMLRQTF